MHKKSIEAAEALKSSDENSDKEDETRTEHSDTSSSNHHRKTPTTPTPMGQSTAPSKSKKSSNNGSPMSSSVSPVAMSPPIQNHAINQQNHRTSEALSAGKKNHENVSSPTSRTPSSNNGTNYHLSPNEQNSPSALSHHHPSVAHHYPLNPINPAPDTDPEVFRWVNYNRDIPVSFIR